MPQTPNVSPAGDPPSQKVLDAVVDLLVQHGYEGVSVRKVAAAAGVSIGTVQYHFPTKDAMLAAASDHVARTFQQHLERLVSHQATADQALRALAHGLLGTDDDVRPASVVWLLRAARAAISPAVAQQHAAEWEEVENLITNLIWGARPDQPPHWARHRAGVLLAVIDGLAVATLTEPDRMPASRAHDIVDQQLTEVLNPTEPDSPGTRQR